MHKSNCPDWLCNEWHVPHDYVYVLVFVVLVFPYVLIWKKVYKTNVPALRSALHYCALILFTLITLCIYLGLLALVGSAIPPIGHLILAICYVVYLLSVIPVVIAGLLALILLIWKGFNETGDS